MRVGTRMQVRLVNRNARLLLAQRAQADNRRREAPATAQEQARDRGYRGLPFAGGKRSRLEAHTVDRRLLDLAQTGMAGGGLGGLLLFSLASASTSWIQ